MISKRKLKANRQNAAHSTGPRTAHGKARSSTNSYRHGLAKSVLADPVLAEEVARLEMALSKGGTAPYDESEAHNLAECRLELFASGELVPG
jgi:hypothetical protein